MSYLMDNLIKLQNKTNNLVDMRSVLSEMDEEQYYTMAHCNYCGNKWETIIYNNDFNYIECDMCGCNEQMI